MFRERVSLVAGGVVHSISRRRNPVETWASYAVGVNEAVQVRLTLLDELLAEQRRLTAVEQFDRACEAAPDRKAAVYRARMPAAAPQPGEQYAFEVDLDGCSGCKACVTACHSLNGLEPGETWRHVGVLIGDDGARAVRQPVTASCHHCIDPACMRGCPVNAYEKDPATGIVFHLDDQCIGCRYCMLMCPYDVPQYSRSKGIVRKCDMCRHRLDAGEAPACVDACPSGAIAIAVVDAERAAGDSEAGAFLPAAPDPALTLPTTTYRSRRPLPRNTLPADYHAARREQSHPPLAVMLVLTQIAIGLFALQQVLADSLRGMRPVTTALSVAAVAVALMASALHLGRPRHALRAVIGARTSWLSREVLAFGAFGALAAAHVAGALAGAAWTDAMALAAAIAGACAVATSVMVYAATRRATWRGQRTLALFSGTTIAGGAAALAATLSVLLVGADSPAIATARTLAGIAAVAGGAKLAAEVLELWHARARRNTPLRRRAHLLLGDLRPLLHTRIGFGAVGVALAAAVATSRGVSPGGSIDSGEATAAVLAALAIAWGELIERHLYFVAAAAPRMPGELP
jgi:Fe-S-cluster-containing dehydrogenase component/DMSO reductase anchor subunit